MRINAFEFHKLGRISNLDLLRFYNSDKIYPTLSWVELVGQVDSSSVAAAKPVAVVAVVAAVAAAKPVAVVVAVAAAKPVAVVAVVAELVVVDFESRL